MSATTTTNKMKTAMSSAMSSAKNNIVNFTIFAIVVTICVLIAVYIYKISNQNSKNCTNMANLYSGFPTISNLVVPPNTQPCIRDYYIKTAYNCCSAGNFKNDFVNVCALKTCIQQGVRCLDFEIYSINNKPVIAVSSNLDFYTKQSLNFVPFADAMTIITNYAFSSATCPNPNDPLILHFRIMSNHIDIYNAMANTLGDAFPAQMLLDSSYSYESNGVNFGMTPITSLLGKIIISVDKTNPLFESTDLDEYVNIASNSQFMRALQFTAGVKNTPDMNELINFNKKHMTICLPDLNKNPINSSAPLAFSYGCQMVAMCFQNNDSNLIFYNEEFNKANTAFILKPAELRYIPVTVDIPPPPPLEYSYQTRPVTSDFYSFSV